MGDCCTRHTVFQAQCAASGHFVVILLLCVSIVVGSCVSSNARLSDRENGHVARNLFSFLSFYRSEWPVYSLLRKRCASTASCNVLVRGSDEGQSVELVAKFDRGLLSWVRNGVHAMSWDRDERFSYVFTKTKLNDGGDFVTGRDTIDIFENVAKMRDADRSRDISFRIDGALVMAQMKGDLYDILYLYDSVAQVGRVVYTEKATDEVSSFVVWEGDVVMRCSRQSDSDESGCQRFELNKEALVVTTVKCPGLDSWIIEKSDVLQEHSSAGPGLINQVDRVKCGCVGEPSWCVREKVYRVAVQIHDD